MRWVSADAVIETDWPTHGDYPYADAPAEFPCPHPDCDERYFAAEWLERHFISIRAHRPPEHGSRGMYRKGCRCDPCYQANARVKRAYRAAYTRKLRATK